MKGLFALAARRLRRRLRGGVLPDGAWSRLRTDLAASIVASLLISETASAQAYQCRAPQGPISVPKVTPDAKPRRVPITGYTLALSWSPEFCKNRTKSSRHAFQCSRKHGRFGMVVHGLWPDGRSSWPQWCRPNRVLPKPEIRRNMCVMPSARLQARQWAKHGSCMRVRPDGYFKATRILYNSLNWPDFDGLSRDRELSAGQIRKAFIRANPAWKSDQIGLKLNQRGWLQELRLCYGKNFMPKRCARGRLGPADGAKVKIWRGL